MACDLPAMFREALELAEGDRARLGGLLIESLEPPLVPGRRNRRECGLANWTAHCSSLCVSFR
jgi:hypothetical protein